jgi:hypothetical protein
MKIDRNEILENWIKELATALAAKGITGDCTGSCFHIPNKYQVNVRCRAEFGLQKHGSREEILDQPRYKVSDLQGSEKPVRFKNMNLAAAHVVKLLAQNQERKTLETTWMDRNKQIAESLSEVLDVTNVRLLGSGWTARYNFREGLCDYGILEVYRNEFTNFKESMSIGLRFPSIMDGERHPASEAYLTKQALLNPLSIKELALVTSVFLSFVEECDAIIQIPD